MKRLGYRSDSVRTVVAVGVFTAFAYVCCVIFHFKAGFLSFDLKDAVMTVAAMLFGPVYGLGMVVAVSLIEFITISGTGVYGLIMNLISSTVFVCVGSAAYSCKRSLRGAVIGMAASVVVTVAVMMGANMLVTPYYMHVTVGKVAAMIPTVLLPFNLTKTLFNASLVFILYKPFTKVIRLAGFSSASAEMTADGPTVTLDSGVVSGKANINKRWSVIVTSVAVAVAVLTLVYFFIELGGSFKIGA